MPLSRQIVSSSYVSSDGTRYHLHQELVTDENSCWLCSSCSDAKNHVSQFCVRNVDYGWLRRGYQHTPSLLEECIVRRSRPYSYSIKCSDASSAGLKLKSHVVCVQQAVRMAVTFSTVQVLILSPGSRRAARQLGVAKGSAARRNQRVFFRTKIIASTSSRGASAEHASSQQRSPAVGIAGVTWSMLA